MTLDWQHLCLTKFSLENRTVLEKKHHVCDLESIETVKCWSKDLAELGQNISWYNGSTGDKIKSGGRIEFNSLSLKINRVQLDDAGTYECRGLSSTRFLTIYVNGEFSLCSCCSSFRHYFVTPHHYYNAIVFGIKLFCG